MHNLPPLVYALHSSSQETVRYPGDSRGCVEVYGNGMSVCLYDGGIIFIYPGGLGKRTPPSGRAVVGGGIGSGEGEEGGVGEAEV
jgi:hypothetical protein